MCVLALAIVVGAEVSKHKLTGSSKALTLFSVFCSFTDYRCKDARSVRSVCVGALCAAGPRPPRPRPPLPTLR